MRTVFDRTEVQQRVIFDHFSELARCTPESDMAWTLGNVRFVSNQLIGVYSSLPMTRSSEYGPPPRIAMTKHTAPINRTYSYPPPPAA